MMGVSRLLRSSPAGAVLAVPTRVGPAAPAAPQDTGRRTVLNHVHTDSVDMQQAAGELVLRTRVGSPPARVAPRTQHFGLDLSYAYDLAAGGMIVLVATAVFLGCWCAAPRHVLLARLRRARRPAVAVAAPAGAE